MSRRLFVSIDVETDGLDPQVNQIIECGIVREVPGGGTEEFEFSLPFEPGEHSTARALEVNGWGARDFAPMVTPAQGARIILNAASDRHIVGQNPQFDARFLERLVRSQGFEPSWHHRLVDLGSLVWGWHNGLGWLNAREHMQPINFERVAEFTAIDYDPDKLHNTLYDARLAYAAFRKVVPV